MYQLNAQERELVLGMRLSNTEDAKSQAAEARIQEKLPPIAGLDDDADDITRRAVFERVAAQQHRSFVALNGSAFGNSGVISNNEKTTGVPFIFPKSIVAA